MHSTFLISFFCYFSTIKKNSDILLVSVSLPHSSHLSMIAALVASTWNKSELHWRKKPIERRCWMAPPRREVTSCTGFGRMRHFRSVTHDSKSLSRCATMHHQRFCWVFYPFQLSKGAVKPHFSYAILSTTFRTYKFFGHVQTTAV